jgi:enterochelin esterase-like enzyme/sugar lactone lactonase YvrE
MVLEAVGAGNGEGTMVSIGNPVGTPHQQWIFTPKGGGFYSIHPAHSASLVMAAAKGGNANGTPIVLEADKGQPWQLWAIRKNVNGTYSLLPKHSPDKALDDLGGKKDAGTKQDLWVYTPTDSHLQWRFEATTGQALPVAQVGPPVSEVPQGNIKIFTFSTSVIYPGTTRSVTVFIPSQYDGSKPACVYVQQDGYQPNEKAFLETLIAAKQIPVTIGVFVSPGGLRAPTNEQMSRRNRCFEYDAVGDNFARFLDEEILPFVAQSCGVKLSTNANDRCIFGSSSGGIAAFNAAWQRPDLFSRVYAVSGSFVAFRGGHEFPTLIRKFEARPIRAYLTTATQDMENCAGDWFLLDQEMDKALKFSGYDCDFHIIDGRHCAGWKENFCEAMRFLWKNWPEPVQAGPSAPRVRDVLLDGQQWEMVSHEFQDVRGPACNSKGEVFFVDTTENKIYRIGLDGKATVFVADAAHANSLSVGVHDEIYSVSSTTGDIIRYDSEGKRTVYATGIKGLYVLATPSGGIYVGESENSPGEGSKIWFFKDGKKIPMTSDIKRSTGLAIRPDQWLLSVADGRSKWVYSYQIQPDGTLINKERFSWLHVPDWEDDAGAESVCYAREGQMLVATRYGIQICADDGPTQVILPMPDRSRVMGVCLGGPDSNTLFAFCGGTVWKRVVKIHATGAFSPAAKLKSSPL